MLCIVRTYPIPNVDLALESVPGVFVHMCTCDSGARPQDLCFVPEVVGESECSLVPA